MPGGLILGCRRGRLGILLSGDFAQPRRCSLPGESERGLKWTVALSASTKGERRVKKLSTD